MLHAVFRLVSKGLHYDQGQVEMLRRVSTDCDKVICLSVCQCVCTHTCTPYMHVCMHIIIICRFVCMYVCTHIYSAQNNHRKLVGHLFKIDTYSQLSMASPLEMYSKICRTKLDLVGHIPKWVRNDL